MASLPRLPDYVARSRVEGGAGRISARRANDISRPLRERSLTLAAAGKLLRVAFGRRDLTGQIAGWWIYQGTLYMRVIWCLGECQEIESITINDAPLPGQGVTTTHYLGTPTQDVDPTLAAVVPAYADTMRVETAAGWIGVCYTVLTIEPDALGAFPRSVRAVGKWRKVYDPRTDTTIFSENAALIGRTIIGDPVVGMGLEVYGAEECADWSDTLLGDVIPRGRIALLMDRPRPLFRDWLDMAAELGEFMWSVEGKGIRMTPDAPLWWRAEPDGQSPETLHEQVGGGAVRNYGGAYSTTAPTGMQFGQMDYAVLPGTFNATSWLIEFNVRWEPVSATNYLFDQADRFLVDLNGAISPATGNIQFYAGTWIASDVAAVPNLLTRYSFHYRADETVDIYLDGSWAGSASGVTVKALHDLRLMINHVATGSGAAGRLVDVRIWDASGKTPAQVASLVSTHHTRRWLTGLETDLAAYIPANIGPARLPDLAGGADVRSAGGIYAGEQGLDGVRFAALEYAWIDTELSADSWLIEAWLVWEPPASGPAYLYDQSDRFIADLAGAFGPATGNIQFFVGSGWVASNVPARPGVLTRYSFHYRADETVDIYLDGTHQGQASGVPAKALDRLHLMIANGMDSFGAAGLLSDFRIWDVSGETTQQVADSVAALWDKRLSGSEPGLRCYLPMTWVPTITAHDILSGDDGLTTLRTEAQATTATPTVVEVRHTAPTTDGSPWGMTPVSRSRAGVASGEIPAIHTSVTLDGVYRAEDAANRALARLNRLAHRVAISWLTRDYGIEHYRGRIVRVNHPAEGVEMPARVLGVDLAGPGRYMVHAERHDDAHHPSELPLPEGTTTVPVGVITILGAGDVPDGWALYTDANGRYIRGADYVALPPGATGGSLSVQFAGATTPGGAHPPSDWDRFPMPGFADDSQVSTTRFDDVGDDAGDHQHTYDTGALTVRPATRQDRLIQKTGNPGLSLPAAARVFGLGGLSGADIQRITIAAGRLLQADVASGTSGADQHHGAVNTSNVDWRHSHVDPNQAWAGVYFEEAVYTSANVGQHDHVLNYAITPHPARRRLALYAGYEDYAVRPGFVFMWGGAADSWPEDWYLCDGNNGTPDMRGLFVEIAAAGQEGTSAGDDTVEFSGTTTSFGHHHRGNWSTITDRPIVQRSHENTITHDHTASDSAAYVPTYYALAFIMYLPGQ